MCEICLKLTIKTSEWRQWQRSDVFIANFAQISSGISIFNFKQVNAGWLQYTLIKCILKY